MSFVIITSDRKVGPCLSVLQLYIVSYMWSDAIIGNSMCYVTTVIFTGFPTQVTEAERHYSEVLRDYLLEEIAIVEDTGKQGLKMSVKVIITDAAAKLAHLWSSSVLT